MADDTEAAPEVLAAANKYAEAQDQLDRLSTTQEAEIQKLEQQLEELKSQEKRAGKAPTVLGGNLRELSATYQTYSLNKKKFNGSFVSY